MGRVCWEGVGWMTQYMETVSLPLDNLLLVEIMSSFVHELFTRLMLIILRP